MKTTAPSDSTWTLHDHNGLLTASVCSSMTFFFSGKQGNFVEAIDQALVHLQPHLTFGVVNGRVSKFTKRKVTTFKKWFETDKEIDDEDGWDFELRAGDQHQRISETSLRFWLRVRRPVEPPWTYSWNNLIGYWQVNLPVEFAQDRSEEFRSLFETLAELLPYRSGFAGFGVQYDGTNAPEEREEATKELLSAHPHLDLDCEIYIIDHMEQQVKTASWLTAITDDLFDQIDSCGLSDSNLTTKRVGHGHIIGFGDDPGQWHTQTAENLTLYRVANRLIEPIRFKGNTFEVGPFSKRNMPWLQEWCGRF